MRGIHMVSTFFSISIDIPRLNKVRTIFCGGYRDSDVYYPLVEDNALYILNNCYNDDYLALLLVSSDLRALSTSIKECTPYTESSKYRDYDSIDEVLASNFEKQKNNYWYTNGKWIRIE